MTRRNITLRKALVGIAAFLLISLAGAAAADGHASAAHKLFHWRPFLAPFHAVVLHFPIGFLTVAGILEIYRAIRPSAELRRVAVLVLGLGLCAGIVSALLGLMRAGGGGYELKALELHRLYGVAVPLATAGAFGLQWIAGRKEGARGWMYAYRGLLAATLTLVVVAGHYGGNLTHGSKYLVENAPEFMREFLGDSEPLATEDPSMLDAHQRVFVEKVKPLLEAKCLKCHGPEKQKGGYRLDQPALAFKGGESGKPAIQPGDPVGSHLVQLILLPPQHDDVMPPAGKEPLMLEEIMILVDWIRSGAVFPPGTATPLLGGP